MSNMRGTFRTWAGAAMLAVLLATLVGCGSKERAVVTIEYTLNASKGLPPGLESVDIAPAELGPATDEKWSDITADLLQALIEQSKDAYGVHLRVAAREQTKQVMQEADLNAAGLTEAVASGAPPKLMGIQAIITSKVNILEEVAHGKKTSMSSMDAFASAWSFGGGGGGGMDTREVDKVKKNVEAQATFQLVDVKTGEVWVMYGDKESATEETNPSFFFGSGEGEAGLTPTDRIAGTLVERVAREFLSMLMPCQVTMEVEVESSGNKACARGVALMRADEYAEALSSLKAAMAEDPEDHRACFAAGVACEAMGRYEDAMSYYKKAVVAADVPEYIEAKKRLDADMERIREEG
jgi:hypothetical protein